MRLAVASGKGGTGKTTVATNLAAVAARAGQAVTYLDCDVEEPNGALFLQPQITETIPVHRLVPVIDADACTACGQCVEMCEYNALALVDGKVLVFEDLCRACGGCLLVCPVGAISEQGRQIGSVRMGRAGTIDFVEGLLNVAEARGPAIIAEVVTRAGTDDLVIVDVPPGTSGPVIKAVRGSDYLLLVTEPTPFGLHDLSLAMEMARAIDAPCGVVINRSGTNDHGVLEYCRRKRIEVLATIPDDRAVAEAYATGQMACDAVAGYGERFSALLERVGQEVAS